MDPIRSCKTVNVPYVVYIEIPLIPIIEIYKVSSKGHLVFLQMWFWLSKDQY